jgi:hypothetical protein
MTDLLYLRDAYVDQFDAHTSEERAVDPPGLGRTAP